MAARSRAHLGVLAQGVMAYLLVLGMPAGAQGPLTQTQIQQCDIWGGIRDSAVFSQWDKAMAKAGIYADAVQSMSRLRQESATLLGTEMVVGNTTIVIQTLHTAATLVADLAGIEPITGTLSDGASNAALATYAAVSGAKDAADIFKDGFNSDQVFVNYGLVYAKKKLKKLAAELAPVAGPIAVAAADLSLNTKKTMDLAESAADARSRLRSQISQLDRAFQQYQVSYERESGRMDEIEAFKGEMDRLCGNVRLRAQQCNERSARAANIESDNEALEELRWLKANCTDEDYRRAISGRADKALGKQRAENRTRERGAREESDAAITKAGETFLSDYNRYKGSFGTPIVSTPPTQPKSNVQPPVVNHPPSTSPPRISPDKPTPSPCPAGMQIARCGPAVCVPIEPCHGQVCRAC